MGDSDDNFVSFGTALEPIEEEEVARKKPITVAEQIATDENGRRRFHGAFTGGFSAGYYNTVGSKEGWTPATFKSSRSERSTSSAIPTSGILSRGQNVTDFMDEEDMGAFGIAPQVLRQTEEFSMSEAQAASRKRSKAPQSEGPIPGMPVLHQIIQPAKETVGIKILIKMGWRPGQGVGPRISKTKKDKTSKSKDKSQEIEKPSIIDEMEVEVDLEKLGSQKMYGCQLPAEFALKKTPNEEESSSDEDVDVLYAPEDVESPLCNPKENSFGLGYKGLERMSAAVGGHIDLFGKQLKFSSASGGGGGRMDSKKMGNSSSKAVNVTGEAFGIGAFEEPDEDVYTREDMSSYDFELETGEERRARKTREMLDKLKKKTTKDSCIQGFHFAKDVTVKKKFFPPPTLSPNFQPRHKQRKSRFEKPAEEKPVENSSNSKRGLGRHALSVQERQVLLGEAPAPVIKEETETKALPSAEQDAAGIEERVERIKKFVQVLQAHNSDAGTSTKPLEFSVSKPGFQPFLKNPEKQQRYEKYLTLVAAGFQDSLKDLQPLEMLDWERERERSEFERARDIYKPLTGVMSSRFVTAKSHDISHIVPEKEAVIEKDPSEDPKVAAKLNLFGRLTHSTLEWHPDKVLCKRFNMKDPYPDSKFVGLLGGSSSAKSNLSKTNIVAEVQDAVAASIPQLPKKSLFDNLDFSKPPPGLPGLGLEAVQSKSSSDDQQSTSLEFQSNIAEKENVVPVKAPLDLFKQIFADSSEEEEEEEKESTTPTLTNSRNNSTDNKDNDKPSSPKDSRRRDSHSDIDKNRSQKETTSRHRVDDRHERKILYEKRYSREEQESRHDRDRNGNKTSGAGGRGIFDNLDLSRLTRRQDRAEEKQNEEMDKKTEGNTQGQEDLEDEDVYGPKAPIPPTSTLTTTTRPQPQSTSSSTFPSFNSRQSLLSSQIKESFQPNGGRGEEVVWVEKDAVSSSKKKSKKHSSSKSSKKSKKVKSKEKSKKSKKHKSNKKSSKHKSISDSDSDSSSSVEIRGSLNQKALLAQLKEIRGSR